MRFVSLVTALFLAGISVAPAHPLLQNAMWVQFEKGRVHVAVNVSVREIIVAQSLPATGDPFDRPALPAASERQATYVLQHLHVSVDGLPLAGKLLDTTAPTLFSEPETTFFQYELEFPYRGATPLKITLAQDMLHEWLYAVGTPWDVNYLVRLKQIGGDEMASALLRPNQPTEFSTGWQPAPATVPPPVQDHRWEQRWQTLSQYFVHGVMHILTGWDHLLFVAALVIAAMSFWEMVKVIAAFSIAHTITLTLAVFHMVRLPASLVEPIIALSIIFVAVENVFFPRRAHSWLRLGVAFSFGLIHGLGFAGGLFEAMQGMPRVGTWIALVGFSLGVEIGHQVAVLPLFGTVAVVRQQFHEHLAKVTLRWGSALIALCGFYYLWVALRGRWI